MLPPLSPLAPYASSAHQQQVLQQVPQQVLQQQQRFSRRASGGVAAPHGGHEGLTPPTNAEPPTWSGEAVVRMARAARSLSASLQREEGEEEQGMVGRWSRR